MFVLLYGPSLAFLFGWGLTQDCSTVVLGTTSVLPPTICLAILPRFGAPCPVSAFVCNPRVFSGRAVGLTGHQGLPGKSGAVAACPLQGAPSALNVA